MIYNFTENTNRKLHTSMYSAYRDHIDCFWQDETSIKNTEYYLTSSQYKSQIQNLSICIHETLLSLKNMGIPTETIDCIIDIGNRNTNGHACLLHKPTAFFFAEHYTNIYYLRTFVLHEIIHAFHYHTQPTAYFSTKESQQLLYRLLIVEGIASYFTGILGNLDKENALWGQYISQQEYHQWYTRCDLKKRELCQFIVDNYYSSDKSEIFYFTSIDAFMSSREGYFIGYEYIKDISARTSPHFQEFLSLCSFDFLIDDCYQWLTLHC